MLADPRRIIAVRANMHLGQTVRFLDYRDGQMRSGKVVALSDWPAGSFININFPDVPVAEVADNAEVGFWFFGAGVDERDGGFTVGGHGEEVIAVGGIPGRRRRDHPDLGHLVAAQ